MYKLLMILVLICWPTFTFADSQLQLREKRVFNVCPVKLYSTQFPVDANGVTWIAVAESRSFPGNAMTLYAASEIEIRAAVKAWNGSIWVNTK